MGEQLRFDSQNDDNRNIIELFKDDFQKSNEELIQQAYKSIFYLMGS